MGRLRLFEAARPGLRIGEMADQRDVHFAQTTINDILNQIGPIETPSLFVYSPEGRLVKSFIGETPIEES